MPWFAPLGALVLLGLTPASQRSRTAGLLPIKTDPGISKVDRKALQRRFGAGVTRSGLKGSPTTRRCSDAACRRELAETMSVDILVGATVSKNGPDYNVEVYAAAAGDGEIIAQVEGICEICGIGELAETVEGLAARLRPTLDNADESSRLTVDSEPPGAMVSLDGETIGTTPLETTVVPGAHTIDVVRRGRRTEHVEATLRPGVNESFAFRLAPSTRIPAWLPWTTLGAGGASLITGIALIVIDEDPIERDCNPDTEGNCQHLYDTVVGGVALTVTGTALAGTGLALWLVQRREDRHQRSRALSRVRLVPGPRGIALTGRF